MNDYVVFVLLILSWIAGYIWAIFFIDKRYSLISKQEVKQNTDEEIEVEVTTEDINRLKEINDTIKKEDKKNVNQNKC